MKRRIVVIYTIVRHNKVYTNIVILLLYCYTIQDTNDVDENSSIGNINKKKLIKRWVARQGHTVWYSVHKENI